MSSLRANNIRPIHPGAIFREDVLPYLGISQVEFARKLGVSRYRAGKFLNEHTAVTPALAVKLEKIGGGTADTWLRPWTYGTHSIEICRIAPRGCVMRLHERQANRASP
jgi:antitoxin HigA-1